MTSDEQVSAPDPLPAPVIDTHCHLDISDADRGRGLDPDTALEQARAVGVRGVVQVACDVPSARWAVEFARTRPEVVAAVALHPNEVPRVEARAGRAGLAEAWAEIERLAADPAVRAVGETGLDFYRTGQEGRSVQEESFRRHIAMASSLDRTLVIHDRDAHDDVVRVLESEGAPQRVVFHCFSGDVALARICRERGWFASFAGVVTFKGAADLRTALREVPDDLLLVETDAPYLTPAPHRGRANASYLMPWTVRAIAEARDADLDHTCHLLEANAVRAFGPIG